MSRRDFKIIKNLTDPKRLTGTVRLTHVNGMADSHIKDLRRTHGISRN